MTSANKSKILQGIYRENLLHVVRGQPRRQIQVLGKKEAKHRIVRIATFVYSVLISVVIISFSNNGNISLATPKTTTSKNSLSFNAQTKVSKNFVELYYFRAARNIAVVELSALERTNSDYRYTNLKHVSQSISNTLNLRETKFLATYVQKIG